MADRLVTRGEFNMLMQQVAANEHRIDSIDSTGSRGVGVVQTQLLELTKDVTSLIARMDAHDDKHVKEQSDRQTARRWIIATTISVLVLVESPLVYLITHR